MAKFRTEHYNDGSFVYITPDEFLEACSKSEMNDVVDTLRDGYGYEIHRRDDIGNPRGEGYKLFIDHLNYIRQGWYSLTKEDAEIIAVLAKKYGAV